MVLSALKIGRKKRNAGEILTRVSSSLVFSSLRGHLGRPEGAGARGGEGHLDAQLAVPASFLFLLLCLVQI